MAEIVVYLSLGSNVGERVNNLRGALAALAGAGVRVTKVSSFYETEPVDLREQPWFLNCVVEGTTEVSALELLRGLRQIEQRMGSTKLIPKGPRIIDLDILLYGDETIDAAELRVPHPRMLVRKFVLVPLAEIAPDLRHPTWNATVAKMVSRTSDASEVQRLDNAG